jgi:ABC-type nitrate/sulfonate/bicarbonate transport system substrate-binding protein
MQRKWFIRPIALVLGLALALAGCGSGSDSATAGKKGGKTVTVGVQLEWDNLLAYVALDQGFMEKHGISDVKYVKFTDLPAMMTAVSRGQVDLALQTPPVLHKFNEASSSAKLKFFAPALGSIQVWSARKGSGVPSAADGDWQATVRAFKGKKVGVPARGGLTEYLTMYMAKEVGLEPGKDFEFVAIGLGPSELAAIKSGAADIDGGVPFGATLIAESRAGEPVLNLLRGEGPELLQDLANTNYFASEDRLKENKDLYSGFAAAIRDAHALLNDPANRTAVEKVIQKYIKTDPARAKVLYEWIDSFKNDLSRETMERTLKAGSEAGMLPSPAPTYDDLVYELAATGDE